MFTSFSGCEKPTCQLLINFYEIQIEYEYANPKYLLSDDVYTVIFCNFAVILLLSRAEQT